MVNAREIKMSETEKKPKGYYIMMGMLIGLPIGVAMSTALGSFAYIGVGIAIGLPIGVAMEEEAKKKDQIRDVTPDEEKQRKKYLLGAVVLIGVLVLATLAFLFWNMGRD